MKKPQTENGFMRLATGDAENDIITPLISADLTGVEYQVVLLILRKTYGHNKKEDWIAQTQFLNLIGRTIQGINKAIRALEEKRIITKSIKDGKAVYSFNKLFHEWNIAKNTLRNNSFQKGNESFVKGNKRFPTTKQEFPNHETGVSYTKETPTKENVTKERASKKNATLPNMAVGKLTATAEIESLGERFREIGMELAGWEEHYAQKTWDQRLNLRAENREKYYDKVRRIVMFYGRKGNSVRSLTKKMCFEIAGMVNDLGAMEQVLSDEEIRRREELSQEQV